jgi:phage tail-like protein
MYIQLPSVQLDAVAEDTQAVTVANRNPQPGEVQIPTTTAISFDLFGATIPDCTIRVNDELAVSSGASVNGWALISTSLPGAVGLNVQLMSPVPFGENMLVRVRLEAGPELEFWAFTTYDTQPPLVANVIPLNKDQLRVTFNEPVDLGLALVPANYWIERVSRPAATPTVSAVEMVSVTEVILTTAFELSFGAQYMLVVSDVTDEFGNLFLPPDNVFEFQAYLPPFPAGRRWLLHDFVPRMSLAEDTTGDLTLFLGCLQDTNNILLHSIDKWLEIIDPDTAPEAFVDAMLVDLGNPFTFAMTGAQKRRFAKILVRIYQLKGTALGIIDVVRFFLGIEVTIETFVGRGWIIGVHQLSTTGQVAPNPAIVGPNLHALYCFRVLTNVLLTAEQRAYIRAIAIYMKGAQEHLVGIRDATVITPPPYCFTIGVTAVSHAHLCHVAPPPPPQVEITSFTLESPLA